MDVVPEVQCLVVVDLQRVFVEGEDAVPAATALLPAVEEQLAAARAAGALVVLLQNDGPSGAVDEPGAPGWELSVPTRTGEPVVRKTGDSGFDGTALHELLQAHGVRAVSVCGLMSEMCVAATARGALDRGYRVVLAHDSHATYDVPAFSTNEPDVPAELAARAAEWALGDEVEIVAGAAQVDFVAPVSPVT